MARPFEYVVPERATVSEGDRALIDAALAQGKITACPALPAAGVSYFELVHGFVGPAPRRANWLNVQAKARAIANGKA